MDEIENWLKQVARFQRDVDDRALPGYSQSVSPAWRLQQLADVVESQRECRAVVDLHQDVTGLDPAIVQSKKDARGAG